LSLTVASRVVEWSPTGVTGFDTATRQITTAGNFAELAGNYGGGPITVAVSRRSSFIKAVRVPNAGASEIDMILRTQMVSMFPVPLSELAYSFRLTNDISDEGRLAIVSAMRESDLISLQADARTAGFKVDRVLPAGFGAMILAESLSHPDSAVIQKTAEGLTIDLIAGGELRYSRITPFPGDPGLIDSEISRSFAAVGLACAPTIAAGGIQYPEAETMSAMPTIEALTTTSLDRLGVNLETQEVRAKRASAAQTNRTRLAVLLCAGSLLLAFLAYDGYAQGAEALRISNGKWAMQLGKLRKDRQALESEVSKLQATDGSLQRAFAPAQKPAEILTVVSNHVPKGVWLGGITFDRGKTMYIRGTSTTSEGVAEYLNALTTEPRLREVKLVFANNGDIEKTPVVQFSIQAFPVGNLPLIDAKKKGPKK
jgi:hypothetical protein